MAKEVERKFLVKDEGWRATARDAVSIRQFYLADARGDRSFRVRLKGGSSATLTLKFGGHVLVRDEFDYPIPLEDAQALEAFAAGRIIKKTRHLVDHEGVVFEVDVFSGALEGLVVAELETTRLVPDEALPAWIGREITGEAAYYNASLAFAAAPAATGTAAS
ncbi:MAG: CYTH domain-containing protein [Rhizobiaceae bacterium]|nr:CYTH domain-containing protein [Rhizobiaceae bacterium]MCV0405790.1 CYTH domain-containing protein [Rhizobiaceae bacterium]